MAHSALGRQNRVVLRCAVTFIYCQVEIPFVFTLLIFPGNLTAILETLINDSSTVDRPIVFILEEFQLFCSHRKQTLLYTLMDASQSTKVGFLCLQRKLNEK